MSNVSIDGKEYPLAALSDEAKAQLGAMQIIDNKIAEAKQTISIMQTARGSYSARLKELLTE